MFWTYLIFVIFSPHWQSLVQFFPTQKYVNWDNTDSATKLRKQNQFFNRTAWCVHCKNIFHIIHTPDVEKLQISSHLSSGEILNYSTCGEMSDFSISVMWRNLKLLRMWRNFRFLHICHEYKSEFSPHDKFISTYLICEICDKYEVWEKQTKIWGKAGKKDAWKKTEEMKIYWRKLVKWKWETEDCEAGPVPALA